jgi:hypothetical protein
MRPLRRSTNVTPDGCCDHRATIADEDVSRQAVEILAGLLPSSRRVTDEMMEGG